MDTTTEEGKWLAETTDALGKQHNSNYNNIMLGRPLALAWQELEDDKLKQKTLGLIKIFWQDNGGWEPHKGARKKAFGIYNNG